MQTERSDDCATPARWRLFAACTFLAYESLFDPDFVATIIALGLDEKRKLEIANAKRRKIESLFGHNTRRD